MSDIRVHFYIREFSESSEFPKVVFHPSAHMARTAMKFEAFDLAAKDSEAWVALEMDGEPCSIEQVPHDNEGLYLHWDADGAVDVFKLFAEDIYVRGQMA